MILSEKEKGELRTATVEVILVLRNAYLSAHGSSVSLKHWDHLQTRILASCRTTASPEEWATALCRRLQIPPLSKVGASAVMELVHMVTERGCSSAFLDLVEMEHAYLIAKTRLIVEAKKKAEEPA